MKSTGKRALIVAAAAVAVVPLLAVTPAPAVIYGSCGGTWTGSSVCTFPFAGTAFSVQGSSQSFAGGASVGVQIVEPSSGLVLMSCYATGNTYTSCTADNQITTIYFQALPAGVLLQCRVSGLAGGTFLCTSRLA